VNEWLVQEGYLVLREQPSEIVPFAQASIDWDRTRAWGEGGYYCRLCCNVQGWEPQGIVPPSEYEALLDELIAKLEPVGDPQGRPIGTHVYRPSDLWKTQHGIPPDLIVYFGDLGWRSVGSLGHGRVHTFENDTGPDDANHAKEGLCIAAGPGIQAGRRDGLSLYDISPEHPEGLRSAHFAGDARRGGRP
jgi:predicted AlkP superfamily phosphohydrolase/phosphomutase